MEYWDSLMPTARERKLKADITKHPSITGGTVKRKLTMTPMKSWLRVVPPPLQKAEGLYSHTQ